MPVGIGLGGRAIEAGPRRGAPPGFHRGALWLAAAAPVLATLLLVARLTA